MLEVRKRGGFSDRNGIKKENTKIQLNDLDERTRNRLITYITDLYIVLYSKTNLHYSYKSEQKFCRFVISEIYSESVDCRNDFNGDKVLDQIIETIESDTYDSVLTVVESIVQYLNQFFDTDKYDYCNNCISERFNKIFEEEYVGYRFVGNKITAITDKNEIDSIDEAIGSRYKEVNLHLKKAIDKLSDRENPDYENSIKESISAVEAMCEIITKSKGSEATLGNMLKKLEEGGIVIHKALKNAFNQLYGYTNDANGIRHAGDIGGPSSTFEEAKFMLTSCSAFINYLKVLQSKAK